MTCVKTGHQSAFQRLQQHRKVEGRSGGAAKLLRSWERTGKTLATRLGCPCSPSVAFPGSSERLCLRKEG